MNRKFQIPDKKFKGEKPQSHAQKTHTPGRVCAQTQTQTQGHGHRGGISWAGCSRSPFLAGTTAELCIWTFFSNSSKPQVKARVSRSIQQRQDHRNLCLVQNSTTSWKVPGQLQVPKSLHFPVQPILFYGVAFGILYPERHAPSALKNPYEYLVT